MDRINADLLRTFIEVARLEHLGRAAEALQNDQSTVSRKIARLEHEVGVPLFERIGRSIRMTKAGRRFVGRAERILSAMRDAGAGAAGTAAARARGGWTADATWASWAPRRPTPRSWSWSRSSASASRSWFPSSTTWWADRRSPSGTSPANR